MKWLFLILLVACGVKNPPAKDVGDADGDQIPNYLETQSSLSQYVAEVVPFGQIEGEMKFKINYKPFTVKLSNQSNTNEVAKKLLTRSFETIRKNEFFSEWSDLLIDGNTEEFTIPDGDYEVIISVKTQETPKSLFLYNEKTQTHLSEYGPRMVVVLNGNELRGILSGKVKLSLRRSSSENPYSVDANIRERTYRVYYHTGHVSKVQYVSKELTFNEYLKRSGVIDPIELKSVKGFVSEGSTIRWWIRHLENGDKVVFQGSHDEITEFHKNNFNFQAQKIGRENGGAFPAATVMKVPNSKLIIRFRAEKTRRSFVESHTSRNVGGARGERNDTCYSYFRNISKTENLEVTKDELLEVISVSAAGIKMDWNEMKDGFTEGEDDNGKFLELALDKTPDELTFQIPGLGRDTYVKTGNYMNQCGDWSGPKYGGTDTNIEGHLTVRMETFIEKID